MAEWELNYADQETLRPRLLDRCKQAVRKYFLYMLGVGAANQKEWIDDNMGNIDQIASEMTQYVTSEPTFIAGGTSIADAAIQTRVESVINSYYLPAAV